MAAGRKLPRKRERSAHLKASIGGPPKMDRWRKAVPALAQSLGSRDAEGFTRAFMTTDAFPKFAMREVTLSGGTVRLTVMAKGAGMIC